MRNTSTNNTYAKSFRFFFFKDLFAFPDDPNDEYMHQWVVNRIQLEPPYPHIKITDTQYEKPRYKQHLLKKLLFFFGRFVSFLDDPSDE